MTPEHDGIYWIKVLNDLPTKRGEKHGTELSGWIVAQFASDDWWYEIGDDTGFCPDRVAVIGPEILPPNKDDLVSVSEDEQILIGFAYDHLPPHLQDVPARFFALATELCGLLAPGIGRTVVLHKLFDSRSAAVHVKAMQSATA